MRGDQMNRPRMPAPGQNPGGSRPGVTPNLAAVLLQRQQQMLLQQQQQQFLMRQQIIQQEQLQRQRLLRQQEEKAIQERMRLCQQTPQLVQQHLLQLQQQQQKQIQQQQALLLSNMQTQLMQQNLHLASGPSKTGLPQSSASLRPASSTIAPQFTPCQSSTAGRSHNVGHPDQRSRQQVQQTSERKGQGSLLQTNPTASSRSPVSQGCQKGMDRSERPDSVPRHQQSMRGSADSSTSRHCKYSSSRVEDVEAKEKRRDCPAENKNSVTCRMHVKQGERRREQEDRRSRNVPDSLRSKRVEDRSSVRTERREDISSTLQQPAEGMEQGKLPNSRDLSRSSSKERQSHRSRRESSSLPSRETQLSKHKDQGCRSLSRSRDGASSCQGAADRAGRSLSRSHDGSSSSHGAVDRAGRSLSRSGDGSASCWAAARTGRRLSRSRDGSSSSRGAAGSDVSQARGGDKVQRKQDDSTFISPRESSSNRDRRSRSLMRDGRSPKASKDSPHRSASHSRSSSREPPPSRNKGELSQYRHDLLTSDMSQWGGDVYLEREGLKAPSLSSSLSEPDDVFGLRTKEIGAEVKDEVEEDVIITTVTRDCPADLYFVRNDNNNNMEARPKMVELETKFEEEMMKRLKVKEDSSPEETSHLPHHHHHHHRHHHHHHTCSGGKHSSSSSSSSEDEDDDEDDDSGGNQIMEEWEKRKKHPQSLHPELWFNLKGQANDGPLCRCSIKSRQSGIRHDIYPGETAIPLCDPRSNNLDRLYHYRMTMSPYTNFLTKVPTLIHHDDHEFIFEGFSLLSHFPLENIPPCKLLRFNIEYTINFVPEAAPRNYTIRSLNLFNKFIFHEILELIDMDWAGPKDPITGAVGCSCFHFLPRFCRTLPDSGCKEMLSMNTVLAFLLRSLSSLVDERRVEEIMTCGESEWHARVDHLRGMIVMKPGMRPTALRIDQLDRKVTTPVANTTQLEDGGDIGEDNKCESRKDPRKPDVKRERIVEKNDSKEKQGDSRDAHRFPLIIHQGNRPAQLSYAGDPVYRKAWKQCVKFRHLLNSKPKVLAADKVKLKEQEEKLREIRMKKTMKREVTVELSSQGFLATGLRADLCQHALMVPVLMSHLRFHICLGVLEDTLQYKFIDRNLLQLSLTHTSYRTNYGTNPDHTRNSLTNCGMRQVDYGDRRIHYQNTRKRGICTLVDIMSRMGKQEETPSEIPHNERLEFLGDAVIEFLTSVHLFYMFPWLEEGGLTTFRMALVQNQHLAVLAKKLKLQDFMLYVHGPDLCHESDLRHAMANCCEAIMGALFLDGGIEVADAIFSRTLFDDDDILLKTWIDIPKHVLQHEEPGGDRHWIKSSPVLQKLEKFEETLGIKFTHIRLLAKSFTHRNIRLNPLTRGNNQRLEFLGDTVLQLVASEYLYRHYPEHHEGHLSLLRSSLVNSRTQGMVYDDLGMSEYVIFNENTTHDGLEMKTKQRADILESFVGALFVDKDLDYCRTFCDVCFFPRLKDFIINQDWNDPKSQLQQCCLTLREVGGGEPDIPVYKVIESIGPTNTRIYVVAVYFRGKRLARGSGHNIQQAEMAAATQALKKRAELFPILQHQRRFLERIQRGQGGAASDQDDEAEPPEGRSAPKRVRRSRSHQQKRLRAGSARPRARPVKRRPRV